MSYRETVIIEHLQGGQPRAYADSVYEAIISIRVEGMLTNGGVFYRDMSQPRVEQIVALFVRPFARPPKDAWSPVLEVCEPTGPTTEMVEESHPKWKPKKESRWRVVVRQPYCD